jgi:peptidyl-prolyl cis-trans isomerase A (cyclophilin A)
MRIAHALAILALGCTLGCPSPGPTATADAKAQKAPAAAKTGDSPAGPANPALLDPTLAKETAPDSYRVQLDTTKGKVVIEVRREWSPEGADRFYNLVKIGFFDDVAFFRAIDGFMVQFGLSGDPAVQQAWNAHSIPDDPAAGHSNKRGYITFAKKGNPNSRTTQVFINYKDNAPLDAMGFTPFGEVVEGMEVIDNLYKGYGEGAPKGKGPDQMRLQSEGNAYLQRDFPELDYVKKAAIVEG